MTDKAPPSRNPQSAILNPNSSSSRNPQSTIHNPDSSSRNPQSAIRNPRIIVVLDCPTKNEALHLVDQLDPTLCRLKIGKETFTRFGPELVRELMQRGFEIFLDLKFYDIPNQVAGACAAAADLGVWMVDVHILGGSKMLIAARDALAKYKVKPLLIGVSLLTSMDEADTREIGLQGSPQEIVKRLATLAHDVGLDGVVCSAQEAAMLRQLFGAQFCLVTPGIRLTAEKTDDQKRIMTPAAAIAAGADYLVIGRPITAAQNPLQILQLIQQQIANL